MLFVYVSMSHTVYSAAIRKQETRKSCCHGNRQDSRWFLSVQTSNVDTHFEGWLAICSCHSGH